MENENINTGYEQTNVPQEQQGYGQQQGYAQQQYGSPYEYQSYGEDRPLTALEILGNEFANTRAGTFQTIEDLAKSYNNLVSLMGGRIENLPPAQKAELAKSIGINNIGIPRVASDYKINSAVYSDNPKYVEGLKIAAHEMQLSQVQAEEMTELLENFGVTVRENALQSIQQYVQDKAVAYMEESQRVFGDDFDTVVQAADYVIEKIVPHVCGMDEQSFCGLLADHGLIGHPAMLALLGHIGVLYAQGRGSITSGIPAGTYASGENDLDFYKTTEAQRILANKNHPRYNEYYNGLMDAASNKHMR